MLTTCPECRTTFRVANDQLDARRGMVRCGHCRAVFNAYDTLLPEFGTSGEAAPEDELPVPVPPPLAEGVQVEEVPAPPAEAADRDLPLAGWENEPPEPDLAWEVEDVVEVSGGVSGVVSNEAAGERPAERQAAPAPAAESPDDILLSELPTRAQIEPEGRSRTVLYVFISLLLTPLLFAQAAYFLRGPLVLALPETRPWLERACHRLGCEIPLARQLEALRVESSSLETDPEQPNRAKLRVSFSNRSDIAQAWPHLLLKLTDPRGGSVAQRAFGPADYLPRGKSTKSGMPPMSEQEFQLDLDLGGLSAAGYEVRPHYP